MNQDLLKDILRYDPETGIFTWRKRDRSYFKTPKSFNRFNNNNAGEVAGYIDISTGYWHIYLFGKRYKSHRLAWMYVYGYFPEQIDHINGIRTDNRLKNLRQADYVVNARNRKKQKNNSSGIPGVNLHKGCWIARIHDNNGKRVHLGSFPNKLTASMARFAAEVRYGYHPNHGR